MRKAKTKVIFFIIIAIFMILFLKTYNVYGYTVLTDGNHQPYYSWDHPENWNRNDEIDKEFYVFRWGYGVFCAYHGHDQPGGYYRNTFTINSLTGGDYPTDNARTGIDNNRIKKMAYLGYWHYNDRYYGDFQQWLWKYIFPEEWPYVVDDAAAERMETEAVDGLSQNTGNGSFDVKGDNLVNGNRTDTFTITREGCKITSIEVYFKDGTKAENNEFTISETIENMNSADSPKFYIVNNTNKEMNYIKINYDKPTIYYLTWKFYEGRNLRPYYSGNAQSVCVLTDRDIITEHGEYTIELKCSRGNLIIDKKDSSDETDLSGAQFILKYEEAFDSSDKTLKELEGRWVGDIDNGISDFNSKEYNEYFISTNNPKETGNALKISEGKMIKGLAPGKYHIYEIKAPTGYILSEQKGYNKENDWVDMGTCTIKVMETKNVTLYNTLTRGDIKIKKVDKDGKALKGAKFILQYKGPFSNAYNKNTLDDFTNYWVALESSNNYFSKKNSEYLLNLSDPRTSATKFTTGTDGTVTISGLALGYYEIYEVEAPEGYVLSDQNKYDKEKDWVDIGKYSVESNGTKEVGPIINASTRGNLEIKKIDSITGEPMAGVKFKLYLKESDLKGCSEKWLKGSNFLKTKTGNLLTSDKNAASVYTTDKNGLISFKGIPTGTYEIYEVGQVEWYDMEGQDLVEGTYDNTNDWVYWKTVKVVAGADKEPVVKEIKNTQTRGNLDILKVDSITGNPVSGVKFKICLETTNIKGFSGKWLKSSNFLNKRLTDILGDEESAGIYTTGEDGYIHLKGIPEGTYHVYEIKSTYWYDIEGQEPNKYNSDKDWVDWGTTTKVTAETNTTIKKEIKNTSTRGNLDILKVDSVTGNPVSGVQFKLKLKTCDIKEYNEKWLKGSNYLDKRIGDILGDEKSAGVYTTGKDGYIHLKGIPSGTYEIYEIKADVWHDMEGQVLVEGTYDRTKDWVYWKTVKVVAGVNGNPVVKEITNIKTRGNLDLEKTDSIYNEIKLEGAEFKLKLEKSDVPGFDGKWLKGSDFLNNRIENILGDENSASVYTTDKDGLVHFEGIPYGTYHIYEVKAPEEYDITKQKGYDASKGWVDLGTATISLKENYNVTKKVKLVNERIIAKISGFVWLDTPNANKTGINESSFDSLWGTSSDETRLAGIPVELCVNDAQGFVKTIAAGITNENGEYEFTKWSKDATATKKDPNREDLYYWDLVDAFVMFTYDNKQYVCVNPFVGGVGQIPNNSKAKEWQLGEEKLDDSKLTGMSGQYATIGHAQTAAFAERGLTPNEIINKDYSNIPLEKWGLTAYVKANPINKTTIEYVVENINLGLWKKYEPSFNIVENIQYSKVRLNGYTYTYDYANGDNGKLTNNYSGPEVSFQQGAKTYGAVVYPSDIKYTEVAARDNGNGLQMYVVYKIDITNTTTTDWKNIYSEYMMYINSLVNSYDSERFEICSDTGERETWKGHEYFGLWSTGTNEKATYKQTRYNLNGENGITGDKLSEGLEPGKTKSVYIQFKANQSYLEEMLTANVNKLNEQMKRYATSATADVYHAYYRTDNVWDYGGSAHRYKGARGTETLAKGEFLHRTENESKQAAELLLVLRLGNTRTISGKVFEDIEENPFNPESETMQEALGNGIMDNGETNRASGVKVELINAIKDTSEKGTEGPQIAKLYDKDYPGGSKDAVETTGTDGQYTFSGVVPGLYYLRFTYSNGSTKIVDARGNSIDNLTSRDYKSTIIDKNGGQTGLLYNATELGIDKATEYLEKWKYQSSLEKNSDDDQRYVEWYKYLDGKSYNIATDDLDLRNALGEYTYDENGKVINSRGEEITTFGEVYSNSPYFSISIENDINSKGTFSKEVDKVDEIHKPLYDRFHFGVIKVPQTNIKIDKVISNIKLINTQGTVLSQGDPKNTTDYVTALDKLGVGSKYARIEMEMQNIYGSQVETTYQVTISNLSEKDYIELDPNNHYGYYFKYGDKTNAKLKQTTIEKVEDNIDKDYDIANAKLDEEVSHPEGSRENAGETVTNKEKITETVTENTGANIENNSIIFEDWSGIEAGGNTRISYIVKGLFQEDMDLDYNNSVRIISFKADKGTTLQSNYTWPEKSSTKLVVTPDTGENRSPIYFIIGTIALIIIATGIVIIKKKVIK